MKQLFEVRNLTNPYDPQRIGTLDCHRLADSAREGTRPPLIGGKTLAEAIYTGPKSNQIRREGSEDKMYYETSKLLSCRPDLCP